MAYMPALTQTSASWASAPSWVVNQDWAAPPTSGAPTFAPFPDSVALPKPKKPPQLSLDEVDDPVVYATARVARGLLSLGAECVGMPCNEYLFGYMRGRVLSLAERVGLTDVKVEAQAISVGFGTQHRLVVTAKHPARVELLHLSINVT